MKGKIAIVFFLVALLMMPSAWSDAGPIPPGETGAKAALERSPRHHEWADISVPGRDTKVAAFIAYPERKDKAPVVIVIQEVYGLSDWIRAVADRLAEDGFIAIAPDFLSGKGPGGGGTDKFGSRDDVVKAVRSLEAPDVVAVLDAVSAYGRGLPAAKNKVATVGFCWGGAEAFTTQRYGPNSTPPWCSTEHPPTLTPWGRSVRRCSGCTEGTTPGSTPRSVPRRQK